MKETIIHPEHVPLPVQLCNEMHLKPGQTVVWEKVSATEVRLTVLPWTKDDEKNVPDPTEALDLARQRSPLPWRTTAEYMQEIRGDDYEEEENL